mmetsp:Transcript_93833/g.223112  ORF Transcript_93833/g.223112 Transcript_93833/m.223112 type:complete len:217 (-) Transcript_93833:764-1414(-)
MRGPVHGPPLLEAHRGGLRSDGYDLQHCHGLGGAPEPRRISGLDSAGGAASVPDAGLLAGAAGWGRLRCANSARHDGGRPDSSAVHAAGDALQLGAGDVGGAALHCAALLPGELLPGEQAEQPPGGPQPVLWPGHRLALRGRRTCPARHCRRRRAEPGHRLWPRQHHARGHVVRGRLGPGGAAGRGAGLQALRHPPGGLRGLPGGAPGALRPKDVL